MNVNGGDETRSDARGTAGLVRRGVMALVAPTFVALLVPLGCNAILDNKEASAVDTGGDASLDVVTPVHDVSADAASDADIDASDATTDSGDGCAPDEKRCFGKCESRFDPTYGCASAACGVCMVWRATSTCKGGACAIEKCTLGFADCNQDPSDGCETDLSQPGHCGACNAVCNALAPLCTPTGTPGEFGCVTGCTGQAPTLCGQQCADLTNSATHCGSCSNVCPPVANGDPTCRSSSCDFNCGGGFHKCGGSCASNTDPATCGGSCTPCSAPAHAAATCNDGHCAIACDAGYHECNGQCFANTDPATCGASCSACPAGANSSATCNGTSCAIACATNFGDCDGDPTNGCESDLTTDPAHCGACNQPCDGRCSDSACELPPDAGGE